MSWFRSFSDYVATVTVTITLEDDTSKTIYSVTNSKVVGGANAVITVNDKIKSIKFYMTSGSVGGNGIGYQLTFVAQVRAPGDKFYIVKNGAFVTDNAFKITSNGGDRRLSLKDQDGMSFGRQTVTTILFSGYRVNLNKSITVDSVFVRHYLRELATVA